MQPEMRERIESRVDAAEEPHPDRRGRHAARDEQEGGQDVERALHACFFAGDCGVGRDMPYWNAVSEKLLSLRECSRSGGIAASFSTALMPMVRCCATWRL